jgi:hypothetical protein
VIIFILVIIIDYVLLTSYKGRGGKDGDQPPHLEVHDDVKDHEH